MEESDTGSTGGEINSAMDIDIQPAAAAPATAQSTVDIPTTDAPTTAMEPPANSAIPELPVAPGGVLAQDHDALRAPPHYITPFPDRHAAAHSLRAAPLPAAAAGYREYANQLGSEANPWAPFASKMDWEVAQWAKMRGPGSTAFTELLEIDGVSFSLNIFPA